MSSRCILDLYSLGLVSILMSSSLGHVLVGAVWTTNLAEPHFHFLQSLSGDLMIRNIQLNHGGKYVCMVDTDVDSLSTAAILVVKGEEKEEE